MNEPALAKAAEAIERADALLVTAGAGMGVDSGLPDFRGPEGFWKAYPAYKHLNLSFSQLANPRWFEADPALAWGFYGHRMNLYRATVPHEGFAIMQKWGARKRDGVGVFTSNVDGHFQKAGFEEDGVAEVHGSIHHMQCARSCGEIWSAQNVRVDVDEVSFRAMGELPRCARCGGMARPNIMMFGDGGWIRTRSEKQQERLNTWLSGIRTGALVIVECGAGTAIPSVRMFSEHVAAKKSATLIRINVREAQAPRFHVSIAAGALEALRAIDERLGE